MTWKTRFLGVALGAMSGALMAQQATSSQSTTTTTTTTSVSGSVVQYSPGQTIVLRGADGKLTTYTLGPSVQVPADVQIGRSVTLSTEPGANGGQSTVTRVEVRTANPADSSNPNNMSMSPSSPSASSTSTTTQYSSSSQSGTAGQSAGSGQSQTTTQTTTTYSGKVTAYSPKQSITLDEPGKGSVTYVIDDQSTLPQDIAVGKTVTITTRTVQGSSKPVVRTVTTTTTTKKTTDTQPQ